MTLVFLTGTTFNVDFRPLIAAPSLARGSSEPENRWGSEKSGLVRSSPHAVTTFRRTSSLKSISTSELSSSSVSGWRIVSGTFAVGLTTGSTRPCLTRILVSASYFAGNKKAYSKASSVSSPKMTRRAFLWRKPSRTMSLALTGVCRVLSRSNTSPSEVMERSCFLHTCPQVIGLSYWMVKKKSDGSQVEKGWSDTLRYRANINSGIRYRKKAFNFGDAVLGHNDHVAVHNVQIFTQVLVLHHFLDVQNSALHPVPGNPAV